jgi:hypothetical protein
MLVLVSVTHLTLHNLRVFRSWYCDGDRPAESIINLDVKLEWSDVTVWSAYSHAEALTVHERIVITRAVWVCATESNRPGPLC